MGELRGSALSDLDMDRRAELMLAEHAARRHKYELPPEALPPVVKIESSWIIDDRGVRPLGTETRRLGALSPRRQKIRERIARYGTTSDEGRQRARRSV